MVFHCNGDAWNEAQLVEVPKEGRFLAGNALDDSLLGGSKGGKLPKMLGGHGEICRRDGITVWIAGRLPKGAGHTGFKIFRDYMLQAAGFLVDFIPGIAQGLDQVSFQEAVR